MEEHSECSEFAFLRDVIANAVPDGEAGQARPIVVRGSVTGNRGTHLNDKAVTTGLVFVLARRRVDRCWVTGDGDYTLTSLAQHSISAIILSENKDILIPRCPKTLLFLYIPLGNLILSNEDCPAEKCSFFNLQDNALFRIAEAVMYHLTARQFKESGVVEHLIPGFIQAAFTLARNNNEHKTEQNRIHLTFRRLSDIDHYIKANLSRSIRVSELSHIAGYSQFHFIRAMKLQTGYSPHQYVLKHRIEKARSLIAKSDIKLADIATELGFHSQAHFTTVFRRVTGLTPGGFRRLIADQFYPAAEADPPHALPNIVLAAQLGFDRQRLGAPRG